MSSRHLRILSIALLLALLQSGITGSREDGTTRADPVNLVIIGVVILLELVIANQAKNRESSIARDDKPTTLATRGSSVAYVLGRRRVGPVFSAVGKRFTRKEKVSGAGKGGLTGQSSKQKVYYESGWHALCVGPVAKFHRITQSGKVIFEGPITPFSHPSGTTIDLGRQGAFRIYWGEADQPVDADIVSLIGAESGWPYLMGVYWVRKRLGTSAIWPLIDYEVEVRPIDSRLTASSPWIEPTRTLVGSLYTPFTIVDYFGAVTPAVVNGDPRDARFRVQGRRSKLFKPGTFVQLVGNTGVGSLDLQVFEAVEGSLEVQVDVQDVPPFDPIMATFVFTDVYFSSALNGATEDGTIQRYKTNEDDGLNPAHAVDQILFQEFPHGRSLDRSLYDIDSLEELGVLLASERVPCSIICKDGENADTIVGSIMQDYGFFMAPDPSTGLVRFVPVREPTGTLPHLGADMLLDPRPEIGTLREELPSDLIHYVFSDRDRAFKDNPIDRQDDSQAIVAGVPRQRNVPMPTVIDYATGTKVANRRFQETLVGQQKLKLFSHRLARLLFPGVAFTSSSVSGVLRLLGIRRDPLTNRVELEASRDYYGAATSSYGGDPGPSTEPDVPVPEQDLAFRLVEIPAYLQVGKRMSVIVPRIRASADIAQADIHFSSDDVTYVQVGTELDLQTGGTLIDPLTSDGPSDVTTGPTFTVLGPDIDIVEDLSGDETSWRLGRQVVAINGELFFLKKVTAIGGDVYRLDGLIRARYDTVLEDHPAGSTIFIFQQDSVLEIQDPLITPGATIFVKTEPATSEPISIDLVPALEVTLHGKGIVPMDVRDVRTQDMTNAYTTGQDVTHVWEYQSALIPGTGAGMQNAGGPTGDSPVDGTFTVVISSVLNVVKRTVTDILTPEYEYTAADRTTDGLEGLDYKISVVNVSGGYSSDPVEITVTNL